VIRERRRMAKGGGGVGRWWNGRGTVVGRGEWMREERVNEGGKMKGGREE